MKGEGSWLNARPIEVSHQQDLRHALIGTGFPYDRSDLDPILDKLRSVLLNCQGVRRVGSGALDICWVADGRLDGFYESLSPWDIAAAALVAEEAGATKGHLGQVPGGTPADFYSRDFVVATPEIFDALVRVLRSAG